MWEDFGFFIPPSFDFDTILATDCYGLHYCRLVTTNLAALPIKEALVRRTIIEDPLCDRCHVALESPLHALWYCNELDTIWEKSAHCRKRREISFLNFKELLSWILTQPTEVELFAMVVWGIWNQRNKVRHNHVAAPLHQIFQISAEKLADFTASQQPAIPMMTRRVSHRTRWQPPLADLVKINFDGAVFSSANAAGIGVVIRDSSGQVLASCSQRLSQAYSSTEVEALAAAKAVSFAAELGITKAVLEGDSLTFIKALSSDHSSLAAFGLIINDIKFSARNFDQLLHSHVKRECNFVAHCLARHEFDISDFLV
ncbi:uncharacterized protein LOC142619445 [Castanea sativa]|uniref:uncharacterized protein LOC142619445 n=1 Tax=Castanea sativa TaxID=21020 RepID=UPI003F6532A1